MTFSLLAVAAGLGLSMRLRVLLLAFVLMLAATIALLLGLADVLPGWLTIACGVKLLVLVQVGYAIGILRFAFDSPGIASRALPLPSGR
jgi:hypothetical protein